VAMFPTMLEEDRHRAGWSVGQATLSALENGIGWLGRHPRICVTVNELPSAVLAAIDTGDSQRNWREVGPAGQFDLETLDLDRVGELWRDRLRHHLEVSGLPVRVGSGTLHLFHNLVPSTAEAPEWVSERDVLAPRVQGLVAAYVSPRDLAKRLMRSLDHVVKVAGQITPPRSRDRRTSDHSNTTTS
jgi:hypothetical protein